MPAAPTNLRRIAEPSRTQDNPYHHQCAKDHGSRDRPRGDSIARGSNQSPRRKGHVKKRGSVETWRNPALNDRWQNVKEDCINQRRNGNDETERRSPPTNLTST
jgi:hypothetical protein